MGPRSVAGQAEASPFRVACVAVLVLLAVACAHSKPATTVAPPAPAVAAPAPGARTPAPPAVTKGAPPSAPATVPSPPPGLDLNALKERLKDTRAIGFFTKLTLKNQVDDLMDRFRAYHQGKATVTIADLRRSYELMLMKVLSLLQDEDPGLASAIVSSREAIWRMLVDPKKFATLQG